MFRITYLSLFFSFLFYSPFFYAQHNLMLSDENTQNWLKTHIIHLSPAETQLVANMVYLLHANTIIEKQSRQFFSPLTHLVQEIKSEILAYNNPVEQLATLKKLLERLSFIASARTIYQQSLTQCLNFYEQNIDYTSKLVPAINEIQNKGQCLLTDWANENIDNINKKIVSCNNIFAESSQYFHASASLLKGISEGELPTEVEENFRSLATLDIFLKSSAQATTSTENILNALNKNTDAIVSLVTIANEIYKKHYEILYNHMNSESFDKQYQKTMFGMYGLLSDEYKSDLPDVQHVFEHVLQTIKLYTQTEFSQP